MEKIKVLLFVLAITVIVTPYPSFAVVKKTPPKPLYDWQLISQSAYPATLQPNQTTNVWIEVKNTGTATWHDNGANPVRL